MNPASRQSQGFTLTENLMAMTLIVTVAIPLTAMLGMATNARNTADHRREAAYLARQIAAELVHSPSELGAPPNQCYPLIAVRSLTGGADDWPYLTKFPDDLNGHSVYLVYDASLRPAGEISASAYAKGIDPKPEPTDPGAAPLLTVRIAFEPGPVSAGPSQTLRATVTVGSPALGPAASRRIETFTTLIHRPDQPPAP